MSLRRGISLHICTRDREGQRLNDMNVSDGTAPNSAPSTPMDDYVISIFVTRIVHVISIFSKSGKVKG